MRRILSIFVIVVLGPSVAAAEERVEATYEVLWGGLEIGRFDATMSVDDVDYRLAYQARTTGFLGWVFPFVSAGTSVGVLEGAAPAPVRFVGESRRRDGLNSWAVEFTPSGRAAEVMVETAVDEQRDPVPEALRRAPDPLALALEATSRAAPGAAWTGTSFDGKRAVRFELVCDGAERPIELTIASQPLERALGCTLDGGVEAGRSKRWSDGRDEARRPARVLVSRELVPGRYWPVRVEASTRFGTVIARLIELR